MKKYHVYGRVSGSKYLGEVEAENEEEAQDKGLNLQTALVSLCHQCSSECEDPEIHQVDVDEVSPGSGASGRKAPADDVSKNK